MEDTERGAARGKPGRELSAEPSPDDTLTLDLEPQSCEKICCLSCCVYSSLSRLPGQIKTLPKSQRWGSCFPARVGVVWAGGSGHDWGLEDQRCRVCWLRCPAFLSLGVPCCQAGRWHPQHLLPQGTITCRLSPP